MENMNKMNYFNLVVLRGAKFVIQYPFTGTKKDAITEAKRLGSTDHYGAVVSVENKSGLVVGVAR